MEPVIEARSLGKTYRLYGNPYHQLLDLMPWSRRTRYREIRALQDVSFDVSRGECVGLVGTNGAGKSTLLKVLSGTTYPTAGSFTVRGRVTSLLELGAGFHQNFTGRENIYMNAAMLGFSRKEARRKYDEIVDFSELGEFVDAPLRTYSSGMQARLAFSVAVATDPDLLIIDEILAVGDMNFQKKCFDRVWSYKARGKAMFFCSHGLYQVRQICDRAIWLRQGRVQLLADAVTVTNEYATWENNLLHGGDPSPFADAPPAAVADPADVPRILDATIVDPRTGEPCHRFAPGDAMAVRVHVRNDSRKAPLTVAVGAKRTDGTLCFAHTTQLSGQTVDFAEGYVTLHVDNLRLLSGEFGVPIWLFDAQGVHLYQERPATQNLIVANRTKDLGLFLQEHRWEVTPLR